MKTFDMTVDGITLNGFQGLSFEAVINAFFQGLYELGNPIFHGYNIVDSCQRVVGCIRETI